MTMDFLVRIRGNIQLDRELSDGEPSRAGWVLLPFATFLGTRIEATRSYMHGYSAQSCMVGTVVRDGGG